MKHLRAAAALWPRALTLSPLPAYAQDWPTRPVRIVSPFAQAGGTADILARHGRRPFFVGVQAAVLSSRTAPEPAARSGFKAIADLAARRLQPRHHQHFHAGDHIPVMNPKLVYHPTRDLTNIAYVAGAPVWVVTVNPGRAGSKTIDQLVDVRTQDRDKAADLFVVRHRYQRTSARPKSFGQLAKPQGRAHSLQRRRRRA